MKNKTILMCEPTYFGVEYEINVWMNGNTNCVDRDLAIRQWSRLKAIVETFAKVRLMEPVEHLPDLVFTANAGLVANQSIILSSFSKPERQPETPFVARWFEEHDYDIAATDDTVVFEGAGDCLVGDDVYWCGYGFRTSFDGGLHISNSLYHWYHKSVKLIELVDPRFYHFDTCFCPLSDGSVLLYRHAIGENSYKTILEHYKEENIIEVSEEDACNFACNAINIDDVIVVNKMSEPLKFKLRARGFEIIETPMSEFIKSGGSCKCLTLEI